MNRPLLIIPFIRIYLAFRPGLYHAQKPSTNGLYTGLEELPRAQAVLSVLWRACQRYRSYCYRWHWFQ